MKSTLVLRILSLALCALLALSPAAALADDMLLVETKPAYNPDDWYTFMLMCNSGSRNEKGNAGNTTMIFSVNPSEGIIKQATVLWDVFVEYPGKSYPQLLETPFREEDCTKTLEVLNLNFQQNISSYLSINWLNLAELIDVYDGVVIDVTKAERNALNKLLKQSTGTMRSRMKEAGVSDATIKKYLNKFSLKKYGPNTKLTGLQAVAYGWLKYDSVMNCCLREVEVISYLFFRVTEKMADKAVFFTDASIGVLDKGKKSARLINLDHMTEDDLDFTYKLAKPIFDYSYNNMTREEALEIILSILRAVDGNKMNGENPLDIIQFLFVPEESTVTTNLKTVNGVYGQEIDYPANIERLNQFLFDSSVSPMQIVNPAIKDK